MLNTIIIMGRLTRDPEVRYTQNQTPVASFSVAVDRDYKSDGGDRETDFIDCVAWKHHAEFLQKYFTKGAMIVVKGRLQIRQWKDKDENNRRSAEVVVESAYFGESKRSRESGGSGGNYGNGGYQDQRTPSGGYGNSYPPCGEPSGFSELEDSDSDLPF